MTFMPFGSPLTSGLGKSEQGVEEDEEQKEKEQL